MKTLWRVYQALLVANFQAASQYRVQSALWLLFAVVRPVVFLAAWSAAAAAQGGAIGDYAIGDFAAYYVCLTLVPKLLRPLHPLHYAVAENLVYKLTTIPVLLPALAIIAWTFQARFATQPWQVVVFVVSVTLAAALRFVFGWVMASLAFWTTRVHGIMHLYDRVVFIFAGQIAPLSLLPGPLAVLGYALPFAYMLWAPAEILRGGMPFGQAMLVIAAQVVWLLLSWIAFVLVW